MHNNWKGHFGISVSELCFKNALGLLLNRSNFREERIIVKKIAATFREERIIARKFGMNHRAKRIIIWKNARIKTIGEISSKYCFKQNFFKKPGILSKFVCITFAQYCTCMLLIPQSWFDSTYFFYTALNWLISTRRL